MLLFESRIVGALTMEADAAQKGEFRALLSNMPLETRRVWFGALADAKDWGLLGVLIAMEPKLGAEAALLDIPGRDEGLKQAAELRSKAEGLLQAEHQRVGDERLEALLTMATRTEKESMEMITLANEKTKGWGIEPPAPQVGLSPDEESRYAALNAKADGGEQLSRAEGCELLGIARKIDPPRQS